MTKTNITIPLWGLIVNHKDPELLQWTNESTTGIDQMYQHHPNRRYRQRAHMVLLSSQGYSQKEIVRIVRLTPRTIGKHVRRYERKGFDALSLIVHPR